jgi:hypothetical protein
MDPGSISEKVGVSTQNNHKLWTGGVIPNQKSIITRITKFNNTETRRNCPARGPDGYDKKNKGNQWKINSRNKFNFGRKWKK